MTSDAVLLVLDDMPWEHGTCSACGQATRRGTGGQWWHHAITDAMVCPQVGPDFVAEFVPDGTPPKRKDAAR